MNRPRSFPCFRRVLGLLIVDQIGGNRGYSYLVRHAHNVSRHIAEENLPIVLFPPKLLTQLWACRKLRKLRIPHSSHYVGQSFSVSGNSISGKRKLDFGVKPNQLESHYSLVPPAGFQNRDVLFLIVLDALYCFVPKCVDFAVQPPLVKHTNPLPVLKALQNFGYCIIIVTFLQ